MDFRFTEEQEMMANVLRELLGDLCQSSDLRRLMESGQARDERRWSGIVDMGLAGALVPESYGGLGLKPVDFVRIAEAAGHACLPEPLVENAGVALPLLAEAAPGNELLAAALEGAATIAVSHPSNAFIADADSAGALLLEREGELHLVNPAQARLERQESVDPFRQIGRAHV